MENEDVSREIWFQRTVNGCQVTQGSVNQPDRLAPEFGNNLWETQGLRSEAEVIS
jgi:hypothetical protein